MATPTYTPLANITLGATANPVTFSSISQSYKDLVLVVSCLADTTANLMIRFNSDSAANYNLLNMQANGSGYSSGTTLNTNIIYIGPTVNSTTQPSNHIAHIMDYSATDKHKTVLARGNEPSSLLQGIAGRWSNTAAITSIEVWGYGTNMRAGTTISLYGVIA